MSSSHSKVQKMQVDKPRSVNQKKYIKRKKRQTFEEINLSECGPNLTETYACLTQCYINQNVIYFQCVAAGIPEATCLATYEKDLNECFYNVINSITVNENLCVPFYYWSKYRDPEGTGGGGTEDRVQTCFNTLRYMSVMFMSIALELVSLNGDIKIFCNFVSSMMIFFGPIFW